MYKTLSDRINSALDDFNAILNNEQLQIPRVDEKKYFDLENKGWQNINLGEVAFPGVYIMVYTENGQKSPSLYIGKASLSSNIARRLHTHLYKSQMNSLQGFNWYGDEQYKLHRVYTINVGKYAFIAPALEEYLISKIQENYSLLNSLGKQC